MAERPLLSAAQNNQLAVVFDPAKLTDPESIEEEADAMLAYLHSTTEASGQQVMAAGEPEIAALAERGAGGVPIDENSWMQLCVLGEGTGVAPPEVAFE